MTLETFLCNWKLNMTVGSEIEPDLEPIPGIFEKNEINNRSLLREIRMAKSDTPCSGTIIPLSLCPPLEGQSHSSWLKLKLKLKLNFKFIKTLKLLGSIPPLFFSSFPPSFLSCLPFSPTLFPFFLSSFLLSLLFFLTCPFSTFPYPLLLLNISI